jgi:hypothetical protein
MWFAPKWHWLKRFTLAATIGAPFIIAGALAQLSAIIVFGAILVLPLIFWLAFIPVLHWKDRYIGDRSNAWGAFLVFETSGWSKLFYWFMHVLPDWRQSGHYRDAL